MTMYLLHINVKKNNKKKARHWIPPFPVFFIRSEKTYLNTANCIYSDTDIFRTLPDTQ